MGEIGRTKPTTPNWRPILGSPANLLNRQHIAYRQERYFRERSRFTAPNLAKGLRGCAIALAHSDNTLSTHIGRTKPTSFAAWTRSGNTACRRADASPGHPAQHGCDALFGRTKPTTAHSPGCGPAENGRTKPTTWRSWRTVEIGRSSPTTLASRSGALNLQHATAIGQPVVVAAKPANALRTSG